jgi:DNA-binding NarL/FixJ family response regulator
MADGALKLTALQRSVLRLVCDGRESKRIAVELGISVGATKQHVSTLFRKLEARNRAQLVRNALLRGLYTIPGYTLQAVPWQETVR